MNPPGDSLKVPANGFVSVRLADGSLVRVQSESDVELRQMRRKGRAGSLQSVLDLREGGVEASVTKQAQSERRFEVRTPAASTSSMTSVGVPAAGVEPAPEVPVVVPGLPPPPPQATSAAVMAQRMRYFKTCMLWLPALNL